MRNIKQFIAGVIVGAMLLSTVAVFAGTQTIEAFFNNIKISIDGKVIELKDSNGNPIEPFIYNGTTYAPVKYIAGALGKETKFNETTNTVELTSPKEVMTLEQIDATKTLSIDNYITTTEDDLLTVQTRPDGTKYVYPGSLVIHFNKKAGKDILKKAGTDVIPQYSTLAMKINKETATLDFVLQHFDGTEKNLIQGIPTNNDSGTYLIPYDEYKNNLLPRLKEAVKQNQ
jgi:hypothetical protein